MRLKDKSNEIILQKQCYYTEKRKQLLKKSSYSVCRKPFNNKKLVYIIEELFNWYTLKRIVLKNEKENMHLAIHTLFHSYRNSVY